ncbi:MAG: PEPxxWA-CTERM sorting domain-containing protein [Phenylobacterium sp.]|uniref:PEPxxWA-CTERM sorting domain-containing protein n=1 Tax=Phenylobacterium sp. TaxID=1871053 RepID=UPI00271C9096|nr:PEPxxWA-CTERM sorting domain-containing protein [Phenylobacterium sp.]MDO9430985.1 PEPxxWA-CTERM sorting domain-containing protein [Phenylobacterium sp.]
MFKYLAAAGAALALTISASAANALTTIAGSVSNVSANSGQGLIIKSGLFNSFNFDLNAGENSGPVGLFTIWTNEKTVEWDDLSPKSIAVSFNFLSPTGVSGDPVEGETFGFNLFVTQGGVVTWDAPEIYTFGNGGKLKISLQDTVFNQGFFGVNEGKGYGSVVTGKFELLSESVTSAVPEPATWAMMITGFGLAGTAIRRRRMVAFAA